MEWTNFHFDCLEPFLSCSDWVALSWCCKYFNKECDLKRTLLRKYRKQIMCVLNREPQPILKLFLDDIEKQNGVISGGFALSVFCGTYITTRGNKNPYGDIDVFYQSYQDNDPFDFSSPNFMNLVTIEHMSNSYSQYHFISSNSKFISHIHNVKTTKNSTILQFINTCPSYELQTTQRPILSPRDHVIGILFDQFDMEFCKIAFTPNLLEICNLPSVIYRTSPFKIRDRLDELTKYNWDEIPIIDQHIIPRIKKYIDRGYTVTNFDRVEQLARLSSALYEVFRYKQFMINYNRRKEEEQRKRRDEEIQRKKKEMERRNAEDELVKKWMTLKFEDTENVNPVRESHISLNKRYVPVVEWVMAYNIPPQMVYLVLSYGRCTELIGICFDFNRIPREWMPVEEFRIARIRQSIIPNERNCSSRAFDTFFWKIIRFHWPQHILIGENEDYTKDFYNVRQHHHAFLYSKPNSNPNSPPTIESSAEYYMNYDFRRICKIR